MTTALPHPSTSTQLLSEIIQDVKNGGHMTTVFAFQLKKRLPIIVICSDKCVTMNSITFVNRVREKIKFVV